MKFRNALIIYIILILVPAHAYGFEANNVIIDQGTEPIRLYLAPEPGSPPFVKPGDTVNEGDTLLLIEAMKTFNPVRAPRSGRVARILVSDKVPVEFGEDLVILE